MLNQQQLFWYPDPEIGETLEIVGWLSGDSLVVRRVMGGLLLGKLIDIG